MRTTVAFRTHIWDEEIETLARRLKGSVVDADFVIIADETQGVLDTGGLPKIAHTADLSMLGLPKLTENNSLWYNGDYPLYVLRKEIPDADHIIMVENDVLLNGWLDELIDYAKKNNVDFVAHQIETSTVDWLWHSTLTDCFDEPQKCLFPFLLVSSRAIDFMLQRRREIAESYINGKTKSWPYCEGFIASAMAEMDGAVICEISRFFTPKHYTFNVCHHYLDPEVNFPGTISHPVKGRSFFRRRLNEEGCAGLFQSKSGMRRGLATMDPRDFYQEIEEAVRRTGNLDYTIRLNNIALEQGWIMKPVAINWALGAKTQVSSVGNWSRTQDTSREGAGAVNGHLGADYSFHTGHEKNPWWKADLRQIVSVRHIIIYNRLAFRERAAKIHVELSDDDDTWSVVSSYPEGILFGGVDGTPLRIRVNSIPARFVRISLLNEGVLHLNQVEVYDQ